MNEAYIRKAAGQAITDGNAVLALPSPYDADELLALGEDIRRSGNAIAQESQVPYPEPPEPPVTPGVPPRTIWDTKVPSGLPAGAKEGQNRMTFGDETFYPGKAKPWQLTGAEPELRGVWYGLQDQTAPDHGTLWHANAYNIYGVVRDLELWAIGDFLKGREGHGLYLRTIPHLDTLIERYRCYKNGGQAVQREWRRSETEIPESVWIGAGGTFTLQDCDSQETGLIDTGTGGMAVRASWAYSLYNTKQKTVVRRCKHTNFYSPSPHEGSLFVGYGKDAWRTPSLLVEDCDFWTVSSDRSDIFLQGVDDAIIRRTAIRGTGPNIDIVNNCKRVSVGNMPMDVTVREKAASGPHNAPVRTWLVKAGTTQEFNF